MNIDLILMLRRSWWVPILTVLVAVAISLYLVAISEPRYEARAQLLVGPAESLRSDPGNTVDSLGPLDREVVAVTYAEILQSERIFENTLAALDLEDVDLDDYTRSAVVLPQSSVLMVTVTGTNPQYVAMLANRLSIEGIRYTRNIYNVFDFHLLDQANIPDSPYSPDIIRSIFFAVIVGGALGVTLMLVRELISMIKLPEAEPTRSTEAAS